jgi:hypothetical protein
MMQWRCGMLSPGKDRRLGDRRQKIGEAGTTERPACLHLRSLLICVHLWLRSSSFFVETFFVEAGEP